MEIQSRTNLNGGDLEKEKRVKNRWTELIRKENDENGNGNPVQDQPKWWRAGKD